jgi:serine/threonine-protein kinase
VFAGAPRGRVIEQDPRGGDRAPRGSTVELIVSKGRNLNRVPDVIGMQEDEAVQALRAREFVPRIFDVPSEEPRGTVVAQVPRGGVLGPPDARVRINVSSGDPASTATERQQTEPGAAVRVPNVVGLPQTSALGRLRRVGLNGIVTYARSSRPRGGVVRQVPAAGTSVARGSDVRIVVSAGPSPARVTVPDVIGLDQPAATQTLEDAGFIVDVIRVQVEDPADDGMVTDQQPAGGTSAPRGAVVTIFVGSAG